MPVFTLNMSQKVRKDDALVLSRATLDRISIDRPKHKLVRHKFYESEVSNNKVMTLEDNIKQS
jgi:hypothetical protein